MVDDSGVTPDFLSSVLESRPGVEVVGLARDGLEALEKAKELLPDVVVMDVEMPCMDGMEATRRIKQTLPSMGVLLISGLPGYAEASVAAGGDGFLGKPFKPEELLLLLRNTAAKYGRLAG